MATYETEILYLNLNSVTSDNSSMWNDTAPSSSVITLGSNNGMNGNGTTFVGYAFHSVDGYSKVGSYTGNGSSDGTFVYCGFKPAFVIFKRVTSSLSDWFIYDNKRSPYNKVEKLIYINGNNTEYTTSEIDFVSNGFKIRDTWGMINSSGDNHSYIAFAEHPFKHTNAR